jgi:hypothetical protein
MYRSASIPFPDERTPHSTWSLERGYDTEHLSDEDFPRRNGRDVGHDSGLRLWLISEKEDKDRQELCSAGSSDAFRVNNFLLIILHLISVYEDILEHKI